MTYITVVKKKKYIYIYIYIYILKYMQLRYENALFILVSFGKKLYNFPEKSNYKKGL